MHNTMQVLSQTVEDVDVRRYTGEEGGRRNGQSMAETNGCVDEGGADEVVTVPRLTSRQMQMNNEAGEDEEMYSSTISQ